MKIALYISTLAVLLGACSSSQSFTRAQEDDIYYVPGKRSLFVEEVKKKTGVDIAAERNANRNDDNSGEAKTYAGEKDNSVNPRSHAIGMARYATEKQVQKEEARTGQPVNRLQIDEGDGYWIGGFHGSDMDLEECVRIMNRYPEGFAYFGNGYEIAQNLSFSSDWNVYTVNNRYWWFPSSSNIALYNRLIFGDYPKYIWTVIWNDPRFDSYAWSSRMSFGFGWDRWGWGSSFGWGNSWGWDPYWNSYYGYHGYNPWGYYDPWGWHHGHYYGYYPGWGHNHWGHRPGHGPNWGHHRPDWGGATERPVATTRYAPKKQYTTNRNARSYSNSSGVSRYRQTNNSSTRYNPSTNRQPSNYHPSYSSGSYSRGSSNSGNNSSSYGRSTTTNTGGGARTGDRVNTGRRK